MLNSLSVCFSVKFLVSPSNLNEILAGNCNIGWKFFSFHLFKYVYCHSLLSCRISAERSAVNLLGVPLYVICHFSLVAFSNFSLSLIFANLITMCLSVFLLGFILYGTLCASWTWVAISFPVLGKFSTIISSNVFSGPFSLSSPSGTPIMRMLLCLMLSQRPLDCPQFFSFFILLCSSYFHYSIFQLTYL